VPVSIWEVRVSGRTLVPNKSYITVSSSYITVSPAKVTLPLAQKLHYRQLSIKWVLLRWISIQHRGAAHKYQHTTIHAVHTHACSLRTHTHTHTHTFPSSTGGQHVSTQTQSYMQYTLMYAAYAHTHFHQAQGGNT